MLVWAWQSPGYGQGPSVWHAAGYYNILLQSHCLLPDKCVCLMVVMHVYVVGAILIYLL